MKFTIAYYLLLLYSLVILKPIVPIVSDAVSHVFDEAIHIATVHAKYGSHHLEKELANAANDNGKNHNAIMSEENVAVHLSTTEYSYSFYLFIPEKIYPLSRLHNLKIVVIPTQAPPPKFC
jgi:hypothetical protein